MKVYCQDCKWFYRKRHGDWCSHRTNMIKVNTGSIVDVNFDDINRHFDCKNYKRKWYKFWIKKD